MKNKEIIAASQEIVSSFHDVGNKSFSNEAASILNKPHFLYVLKDPFTLQIKYVGITSDIKVRKEDHKGRRSADSCRLNHELLLWRNILYSKCAYPVFVVVKQFNNYEKAHSAEKMLIKALGKNLFNIHYKN